MLRDVSSCADLIYFQSGLTVIIMSERYQKHNRPLAAVIPYQSCAGEFSETFHKFHILSAFPNFLFPSCYSTIVFFFYSGTCSDFTISFSREFWNASMANPDVPEYHIKNDVVRGVYLFTVNM